MAWPWLHGQPGRGLARNRGLSIQELDALRLLRDGICCKQIAEALGIATSIVKFRPSITRKVKGVSSKISALYAALQRKLI